MLASDGLTDLVGLDLIGETIRAGPDLKAAVDELIDHALAAGGRDNITCVLGDIVDDPVVHAHDQMVGAAGDPANLIDRCAITIVTESGQRHAVLHPPHTTPASSRQEGPESPANHNPADTAQ